MLRSLAYACNHHAAKPSTASYAAESVARLVVGASADSQPDAEYIASLLSFLASLCAGYMRDDMTRCGFNSAAFVLLRRHG